ncbi:hypothetical protein HID58_074139 [Brassica napus]|uniref:Uncharacterized protein n=1 Tax=Brassica napus TaxID=3708 RepID=A0ABQ7YHM7_BRANA|nr:hypothetical protein HID58_074139 [Brassica napus]
MFNHSREVLLLRFWEAGNVKRGERTYGMFDALALAFRNKFESYGSEPRIVLATTINPKRGRLYLNSTSETHIYFDSETAVGKEMLDKLLMAQNIQQRR